MPISYPFTPNPEANDLLARDGTALLIGLCLDQQVRTEKAMIGPYELRKRLGTLDAKAIAKTPPAKLDRQFRMPPALHRFPGMMAKRVRALCTIIADEYGGHGERIWERETDAKKVYERLLALPGFGASKAGVGVSILTKFGGIKLRGASAYRCDQDLPWVIKTDRSGTITRK
jgi:uncharacterized HhH-GPD family protein